MKALLEAMLLYKHQLLYDTHFKKTSHQYYFHNIHNKNNNNINKNTKRINLYSRNQMHKNYKLDEQVITNIIHWHMKPIEQQKQIKLIIYYTKFKTSNLIIKKKHKLL